VPNEMSDNKKTKNDLATRVALLYYNNNMNQNEIGQSLGISRSYVSQLITYAREEGIVKISIQAVDSYFNEMRFAERFGLKQTFILASPSFEYSDSEFGRFAAPHTMRLIRNAKNIGINLGQSVNKVISMIPKDEVGDCNVNTVVQIMGGCFEQPGEVKGGVPSELVYKLGRLLDCDCLYLNCPAIVSNVEAKSLFEQEESILRVEKAWNTLDTVLMGMGQAGNGIVFDGLGKNFKKTIHDSKAVADINLNFFDKNGHFVPACEDNKMMLGYKQLKKIKMKIVYAYGIAKANAILAGLRAQMFDVLFTDSITAEKIIKLDEQDRCGGGKASKKSQVSENS